MIWKFSQRVHNALPLIEWFKANIPKSDVVRCTYRQNSDIKLGLGHPSWDVYLIVGTLESARKLAAYMDGPEFAPQIVTNMKFFITSWYPHRPDPATMQEPQKAVAA